MEMLFFLLAVLPLAVLGCQRHVPKCETCSLKNVSDFVENKDKATLGIPSDPNTTEAVHNCLGRVIRLFNDTDNNCKFIEFLCDQMNDFNVYRFGDNFTPVKLRAGTGEDALATERYYTVRAWINETYTIQVGDFGYRDKNGTRTYTDSVRFDCDGEGHWSYKSGEESIRVYGALCLAADEVAYNQIPKGPLKMF